MHLLIARLDSENIAVQIHVAAHSLPVDIVLESAGYVRPCLLDQVSGKRAKVLELARIIVKGGARLFQLIAEMAVNLCTKPSALGN